MHAANHNENPAGDEARTGQEPEQTQDPADLSQSAFNGAQRPPGVKFNIAKQVKVGSEIEEKFFVPLDLFDRYFPRKDIAAGVLPGFIASEQLTQSYFPKELIPTLVANIQALSQTALPAGIDQVPFEEARLRKLERGGQASYVLTLKSAPQADGSKFELEPLIGEDAYQLLQHLATAGTVVKTRHRIGVPLAGGGALTLEVDMLERAGVHPPGKPPPRVQADFATIDIEFASLAERDLFLQGGHGVKLLEEAAVRLGEKSLERHARALKMKTLAKEGLDKETQKLVKELSRTCRRKAPKP